MATEIKANTANEELDELKIVQPYQAWRRAKESRASVATTLKTSALLMSSRGVAMAC